MAVYHTKVKTFSRAKGHTSTAAAAYRAGLLIVDEHTGAKHDYRRRGGVVETRCVAPEEAPDWVYDPRVLWPESEAREGRRDSTVCREFEIALPHELDDDQRSELTVAIARQLVGRYRFAVQASIHSPPTPNGLNYHAHLLATTRRVDESGLAEKTRELDGGPSGRGEVEWIREMVAKTINAHLEAASVNARVDHRSLKDRAQAAMEEGDLVTALKFSREPLKHMGKKATALHRKGLDCAVAQTNNAIAEANEASFQAALAELGQSARLMPMPDTHSHARAREERERAIAAREPGQRPTASDESQSKENQITVDPALLGRPAPAPKTEDDKVVATRMALAEATRLWGEGFFTTVSLNFKATTKLLRHQVGRLAAYVHSALFRSDVRELLDRVKQLRRDALRFQRRMKAEDKAQHDLAQAELLLERFESDHPRPGPLTRQEWMRRRARRLRAVQVCQDAYRKAHEATGPEAQKAYNARALATGEQLENLSTQMLARYPVPADQVVASEPGRADEEVSETRTLPTPTKPAIHRPK